MKATKLLFASFTLALALPAVASVDEAFLTEMARSDGNPRGENAVPRPAPGRPSASHEAFMRELARSDGTLLVIETARAEPVVEQTLAAK